MKKGYRKSGFTLIEMLVVIAIIAVLVAIVVPTVSSSTTKAKAAADGANLRSILGVLNVKLMDTNGNIENALDGTDFPACQSFDGTHVEIEYAPSHYIHVYYVVGDNYYGTDYFSEVAQNGSSEKTAKPVSGDGVQWLIPGA